MKAKAKRAPARPPLLIAAAAFVLIAAVGAALWLLQPSSAVVYYDQVAAISPGSRINGEQYTALLQNQPHLLLDVRTPEEFAAGHIAGAVNIPLQSLEQNLSAIPQDMPVVLYCRSGNRSQQALQLLQPQGYSNLYDLGGIIDWQAQGRPVTQ
ncbi:MAG: rhodanese-like domain-containing protein [Anaerolineae bacterium]|jgi:rhodanese-related sulfurtransferase|nr:rhodanese-like domain-containing protein [Anaerolineae bacterium]